MPTGLISVKALYQCYVLVLLTFSAALVQICLTFGLLEIVEFSKKINQTFFSSPDQDVPELSYGLNQRMPSASVAIDLRFAPDRGRFFVATQDLSPGMS